MKSVIVLLLIIVFLIVAYFLTIYLQKQIRPRESFTRLMLYFLLILALVFSLSFLMVFIITRLYPDELIK